MAQRHLPAPPVHVVFVQPSCQPVGYAESALQAGVVAFQAQVVERAASLEVGVVPRGLGRVLERLSVQLRRRDSVVVAVDVVVTPIGQGQHQVRTHEDPDRPNQQCTVASYPAQADQ